MESYKVLGDRKQKGLIWSGESRKTFSTGKWQLTQKYWWKLMKGRGPERGNRLPTGLEAEQEAFEGLTGNYLLYDSSSPLSHEIHFHPSSYQFDISTWMSDRQLQLTTYETGLLIFSTDLLFRQCLPSQHHHVLSCSDLHILKIQLFLLSSHPHSAPSKSFWIYIENIP